MNEIVITEEFDNSLGQFEHYDAPDPGVRESLLDRKHINIRSFYDADVEIEQNIFTLDHYTMNDLDALLMSDLEGQAVFRNDEGWTVFSGPGSVGYQVNPIRALTIDSGASTTVVESVIQPPAIPFLTAPTAIETVDLSTGFADTDHISIAWSGRAQDTSSITFTSNADGDFTAGPSVTIPFSASIISFTQNVTTWQEIRFLRSALSAIDISSVTGVRISFVPSSPTQTAIVRGIRLVNAAWQSAAYDIDTWRKLLSKSSSRTGDTASYDVTWPDRLLRASQPTSFDLDPRPIDVEISATFNSGSMTGNNTLRLFFREHTEDLMTQLDLDPLETLINDVDGITAFDTTITVNSTSNFAAPTDDDWPGYGTILIDAEEITYTGVTATTFTGCTRGTDGTTAAAHPDNSKVYGGYWQDQLDELGHQPDFGRVALQPRQQTLIDDLNQTELDQLTQQDLDLAPDDVFESYIEMKFLWKVGYSKLYIKDAETPDAEAYSWLDVTGILPNTDYIIFYTLEENSARIRIYGLLAGGNVDYDNLIYDTTELRDDFLLKRRKGRFGWTVDLTDGDAVIYGIRTRSLSFAEYWSEPLTSITPVKGAEISVVGSPALNLFTGVSSWLPGAKVETDTGKTANSPEAYKVTNYGTDILQGIETNSMPLEDFKNTTIFFDIFYPSEAPDLKALLYHDEGRFFELTIPPFERDKYSPVKINLSEVNDLQTGNYRLVLYQINKVGSTWWIDNISVLQRTLAFSGRSQKGSILHPKPWLNFQNAFNEINTGIVFPEYGKALQVRGKALRQSSFIAEIGIKPKYAELGRFKWDDPVDLTGRYLPGESVTLGHTNTGPTYNFQGSATIDTTPFGTENVPLVNSQFNAVTANFVASGTGSFARTTTPGEYYTASGGGKWTSVSSVGLSKITAPLTGTFYSYINYTLTYKIKTSVVGYISTTLGSISDPSDYTATNRYINPNAWTQISLVWTPGVNIDNASIIIAPSVTTFSGTVYVDDFNFTASYRSPKIVDYYWTFGDGYTSHEQNPVHTYGAAGSYYVTLTTTDSFGQINTASETLVVS